MIYYLPVCYSDYLQREKCFKMYWTLWLFIIGFFGVDNTFGQGQRIAPGVPPQHYQVQQVHLFHYYRRNIWHT